MVYSNMFLENGICNQGIFKSKIRSNCSLKFLKEFHHTIYANIMSVKLLSIFLSILII